MALPARLGLSNRSLRARERAQGVLYGRRTRGDIQAAMPRNQRVRAVPVPLARVQSPLDPASPTPHCLFAAGAAHVHSCSRRLGWLLFRKRCTRAHLCCVLNAPLRASRALRLTRALTCEHRKTTRTSKKDASCCSRCCTRVRTRGNVAPREEAEPTVSEGMRCRAQWMCGVARC